MDDTNRKFETLAGGVWRAPLPRIHSLVQLGKSTGKGT